MTDTNTTQATVAPVAAAVSLTKGQKVSLTKDHPGLTKLTIGLGWSPRRTSGKEFDLDASCFFVKSDGKVRGIQDMIYAYLLKQHESGAVVHSGDNRTGEGEGDDEALTVDLAKVPAEFDKLVFTCSIYAGRQRGQNFGQVDDAYARLVDASTGAELYRFDLSEDASTNTAVILVRLYRHDGGWKFEGVGQGFNGGMKELCAYHGLEIDEETE